jgi:hypothetical protein
MTNGKKSQSRNVLAMTELACKTHSKVEVMPIDQTWIGVHGVGRTELDVLIACFGASRLPGHGLRGGGTCPKNQGPVKGLCQVMGLARLDERTP